MIVCYMHFVPIGLLILRFDLDVKRFTNALLYVYVCIVVFNIVYVFLLHLGIWCPHIRGDLGKAARE